ncbi:MAG: hypothetical protein QOE03_4021, partial [Micromonosporaceae bacterium]|nr:hypothetical protein [Micromonosporaceae bacterium]
MTLPGTAAPQSVGDDRTTVGITPVRTITFGRAGLMVRERGSRA